MLWSGDEIAPYFYNERVKDKLGVTVNSKPCGRMATDFFGSIIEEHDMDKRFQQDGDTCHITRVNLSLF